MRYLSVCSGIEAATVAWAPLGWEASAFSEIEPFPCAVLDHHYPDIPNWGDLEAFHEWPERSNVDVLVGGTPCQSFSVAGLRKGLDDPRGNLALAYLACAERYRPRWLVWENVPGVLSSWGGGEYEARGAPQGFERWEREEKRAFACFLAGLQELGYGFAYRVLDAQYFGLAQRRRRVFVVGYLGDWRPPFGVLFESESLRGDPPPSREAGQDVASTITSGVGNSGRGHGARSGHAKDGTRIPVEGVCGAINSASGHAVPGNSVQDAMAAQLIPDVAWALQERDNKGVDSDTKEGHLIPFDTTQITHPENRSQPNSGDPSPTLTPDARSPAVSTSVCLGSDPIHSPELAMPQTTRRGDPGVVQRGVSIRRLTPRECERLQGFPDDYTLIPWDGKPPAKCPDGHRYKALGNAFPVPVVRRIGQRIALMQEVLDGI